MLTLSTNGLAGIDSHPEEIPIDVIDLGFGVLTVPSGEGRKLLGDLLPRDQHAEFVRTLGDDPDLATT